MNTKKFFIGTLAGGIVFFFVGYLIYGLALSGFYHPSLDSRSGIYETNE